MRGLAVLASVLLMAAFARAAEIDGIFFFDDMAALPQAVADATWCSDDGPGQASRRPFAGGFVFAIQCPGNNANYIEALVFAPTEDGSTPTLLTFPVPGPPKADANPQDTLSNVRWSAETSELSELFVDTEADVWCRSEGTWRLAGLPPMARLVYWRHTRDCDGKRDWKVVVDKRTAKP